MQKTCDRHCRDINFGIFLKFDEIISNINDIDAVKCVYMCKTWLVQIHSGVYTPHFQRNNEFVPQDCVFNLNFIVNLQNNYYNIQLSVSGISSLRC